MQNTWIILLPPLIALTCVFITKRLITSLLIGIGSAALIAKDFNPLSSIKLTWDSIYTHLIAPSTLYIFGFSLAIGLLIVIMNKTGCALAFTKAVTKHIKNPIHAQAISLLLSLALFIDDYLSNLTVGYVMRPLTDLFKIPRAKLAFLVHSLSGPFVILIPISSWGAIILLAFSSAHIDSIASASTSILADPFAVYLHVIPFIFYSLFTIIGIWYIVLRNISFGPMRHHEKLAIEKGDLFGGSKLSPEPLASPQDTHSSILDFALPLITLVICIVTGMQIFKHDSAEQTFLILFVCALIAVTVSILRALYTRSLAITLLPTLCIEDIKLMYSALIIVMLAMTLGDMLDIYLKVGQYLASLTHGASSALLPLIFFIVSVIISVILGSAWGTISLLTPIAVPMVTSLGNIPLPAPAASLPLLLPVLAAVLSGAVAGNHLSPIADTTILAATSSGSTPLEHAYTQFPYAIPMLIGTCASFICTGILAPYGIMQAWLVAFFLGISCTIALLYLFNRWYQKKP